MSVPVPGVAVSEVAVIVVAVSGALVCALLLTRAFVAGAGPALMDHPNHRSLHEVAVRRTGGLAIFAGIALGQGVLALAGLAPAGMPAFAGCALLVLGVSLADDFRHVAAPLRLAVHAAAAIGLMFAGLGLERIPLPGVDVAIPPAVGWLVSVLFVVWMTNLYNFMDGMDGFAGGMGAIGFATLAILSLLAGSAAMMAACAVIAAACAGFLRWNFPPARIFMGDAGSSLLGFLAALLALQAERSALFPLWIPLLVFSPFVVDATVTLLRRAAAMEPVWQAHRSHFYQRLVRAGWSHRRTTVTEYGLMLACAASAVAVHERPEPVQVKAVIGWVIAYTWLMACVTLLERRRRAS